MTQEDKELLYKDLSARLPYGVKVQINSDIKKVVGVKNYFVVTKERGMFSTKEYITRIECCKPYLRPMSSMTEEELKELKTLCSIYIPTDSPTIGFEDYGIIVFTHHLTNNTYSFKINIDVIDWLNAHQFDCRGLIKKGLALEAPKDMYK